MKIAMLFTALVLAASAALLVPHTAHAARTALTKPANNLGLVGYWPMNEGTSTQAGDFSGNGKMGTLSTNGGSIPTWTYGRRGNALNFNGTNGYVSVGSAGSGIQTISFWMKANVTASKKVIDLDGGTHLVELNSSSQVTATGFASPTVYVDGSSASAVVDTGWHHVAITTDTGFAASAMDIGRVSAGYFNGTIDDVRIYNRALSASEVAKLYANNTSSAVRMNASTVALQNGTKLGPANGLVGHWTFDGADTPWSSATAANAIDRSGNANTGTLTSMNRSSAPTIGKLGQALSLALFRDDVAGDLSH